MIIDDVRYIPYLLYFCMKLKTDMGLKPQKNINIKNKKAGFEYEIIETFTAGLQLQGTEIKSIRAGKAALSDSYCQFFAGELFVKNMHIAEYFFGSLQNHETKRERKLLLQKRELKKYCQGIFLETLNLIL